MKVISWLVIKGGNGFNWDELSMMDNMYLHKRNLNLDLDLFIDEVEIKSI